MRVLRWCLRPSRVAALAVRPAAAQSPRWLLEARGGISAVTGGFGDSQKTGYDLGAGAGYRLANHWRAHLNYDFVHTDAKSGVPGPTGPDYDTHLVMAGLGYEFPVRSLPVAVELGAGGGVSRFQPTGTPGAPAQNYFGLNGGARITYGVTRRLRAELTPQVDVAFADQARLGESRAWLWPVDLGFQYRF